MPNVFSLIGQSWDFYRKQPVLNHVAFWLFILPYSILNILQTLGQWNPGFADESPATGVLVVLAMLLLSILIVWGSACVLLMGKRMVVNRAGRTRTSFKAVRTDAAPLIAPLIFTGILRACITILWALLLIIPGVIYSLRTSFYPVVIATEGMAYRSALNASKEVVRGQTWTMLLYIVGLSLCLFLPVSLLLIVLALVIEGLDPRLMFAFDILAATLNSFAAILFLLSLTLLYGAMKKRKASLLVS